MTQRTQVSVIGPADGEAIQLGAIRMRILEDGHTTDHRLGMARPSERARRGYMPPPRRVQRGWNELETI